MSTQAVIRCLVDDTVLTRNIEEIENWVSQGSVVLVVPLYTLERLHVLKKDSSEIGINARKAVKFLDRTTSSPGNLPHEPVILQGPDDQYPTWEDVEAYYITLQLKSEGVSEEGESITVMDNKQEKDAELRLKRDSGTGGALSQMLLDKLNFSKEPTALSPTSTPPLSPPSSGPQSSKTSPEVKSAVIHRQDQAPVPPSLKPLFNPVVWYMHEKNTSSDDDFVFLTNSADTIHLARDFGIPTKNIHQLRSALGVDETESQKQENITMELIDTAPRAEPKTLFSYDDADSDDEEVIFKPRGRGSNRGNVSSRGSAIVTPRGKGRDIRSPRTSFSQSQTPQVKPQIPIQEIDPDSFDRGSFRRGSMPLANTGNHSHASHTGSRGTNHRGSYGQGGRGGSFGRGSGRGMERGSARGRGRLFVP